MLGLLAEIHDAHPHFSEITALCTALNVRLVDVKRTETLQVLHEVTTQTQHRSEVGEKSLNVVDTCISPQLNCGDMQVEQRSTEASDRRGDGSVETVKGARAVIPDLPIFRARPNLRNIVPVLKPFFEIHNKLFFELSRRT